MLGILDEYKGFTCIPKKPLARDIRTISNLVQE